MRSARRTAVVVRSSGCIPLGGDPTVTVAGELQHDPLYGISQIEVLARLLFGCRGLLAVPRAAYPKRPARCSFRDLMMVLLEPGGHDVPPFEWYFESPF